MSEFSQLSFELDVFFIVSFSSIGSVYKLKILDTLNCLFYERDWWYPLYIFLNFWHELCFFMWISTFIYKFQNLMIETKILVFIIKPTTWKDISVTASNISQKFQHAFPKTVKIEFLNLRIKDFFKWFTKCPKKIEIL